MKRIMLAMLFCFIAPCNGVLTQEQMLYEIKEKMMQMELQDALNLIVAWKDKLDINTGEGITILHDVMCGKISDKAYHPLSDSEYQKLYTHIIKLFKNKIDINIKSCFGETVLHAIIDKLNLSWINKENEKVIQNCLEEFVMEFKDTIDFTSTNKKGKTVFDLCAANPLEEMEYLGKYTPSVKWHLQKEHIIHQKNTERILLNVYFKYRDSIEK